MSFGAVNIIGIILVVEGALNLLGVMFPYAMSMTGKYTPESMKAWIRPMGVASIAMGGGCILFDTRTFAAAGSNVPDWFTPVGIVLMVVGIILGLVFNKIFLKKIK
ncbi:MAG: hypothetical protein GX663_09425 [Clostridiales bacterium]|nr:hypothetical protein [Clostridiales bacterium]